MAQLLTFALLICTVLTNGCLGRGHPHELPSHLQAINDVTHRDGRRAQHAFHSDGSFLEYDVTLAPNVLVLDDEPSLRAVSCPDAEAPVARKRNNGVLELHYEARGRGARSPITPGLVLTASRFQGCGTLIKKVVGVRSTSDDVLLIDTEPAGYTDVFEDAWIEFTASEFPASHSFSAGGTLEARSTRTSEKNLRTPQDTTLFLSKALKTVSSALANKVKTVFQMVKIAVSLVYYGAQLLLTGALDVNATAPVASIDWNYPNPAPVLIGTDVVCENCFVHALAEVRFRMIIEDFDLEKLRFTFYGNVDAGLLAQGNFTFAGECNHEEIISNITFQPYTFTVAGIPFKVDRSLVTYGGFESDIYLENTLVAEASFQSEIEIGYEYSEGEWKSVNDFSFEKSAVPFYPDARADGAVGVYLLPTFIASIDLIGNVNSGIRFLWEAGFEVSPDTGCPFMQGNLNVAALFTVGTEIEITLIPDTIVFEFDWESEPLTIFKVPIFDGCVLEPAVPLIADRQSVARLPHVPLEPAPRVPSGAILAGIGDVWTGKWKSFDRFGCEGQWSNGELDLQLIDSPDEPNQGTYWYQALGYMTLFKPVLDGEDELCTYQVHYDLFYIESRFDPIALGPQTRGEYEQYFFDMCGQGDSVEPVGLDGIFLDEWDAVMCLADSDSPCIIMVLSRYELTAEEQEFYDAQCAAHFGV